MWNADAAGRLCTALVDLIASGALDSPQADGSIARLPFAPKNSYERKRIHSTAEAFGCRSASEGGGSARHVVVTSPNTAFFPEHLKGALPLFSQSL